MPHTWKPGDLVVVVTVNRGLPPPVRKSAKPAKVETWHGVVIGPSGLGPGWWNVRRDPPRGGRGGSVFAVPDGELKSRKG